MLFISLLKHRQVKSSRPCAIATARLLLSVVADQRWETAFDLIRRIREVGLRLVDAQPREMAVGNIVRRVLGVVREVAEEDELANSANTTDTVPSPTAAGDSFQRPTLPTSISGFSPLNHGVALPQNLQLRPHSGNTSPSIDGQVDVPPHRPTMPGAFGSYTGGASHADSLFGLFMNPTTPLPSATPPNGSGAATPNPLLVNRGPEEVKEKLDVKAEVINGIQDLLDELDIVDTQIAESALDHVHDDEIILTHTSSQTIQKFLSTAARKRKFTVFHVEAYPNDHLATHSAIVNGGIKPREDESEEEERWKPLTAMGIRVIIIPDSAVFAVMSRINKVIIAPHTVLANGSLVAAAGACNIAQAAQVHNVPVVVLSGVYKLSPVYPFADDEFIEFGDPGKVVPFEDGDFMDGVDIINPVYDFVDAELISLYITNLGGHAPSYLYRIVADHYRTEDIDLASKA